MYVAKHIFSAEDFLIYIDLGQHKTSEIATAIANPQNPSLRFVKGVLTYFWNRNTFQEISEKNVVVFKIKEISATKTIQTEDDYELTAIKLGEFHNYPDLISGFGSMAYSVEEI